jgi:hypothetical protein
MPGANMPLFTFIAGFVFAYLYGKGKYNDFKEFFQKKQKRLLFPYFILGTIVTLTSVRADFASIGFEYMSYGRANHLWYCLMLFGVFMIAWNIEYYKLYKFNILLTLCSIISPYILGHWGIDRLPWGIDRVMIYYCYFSIAIYTYKFTQNTNIDSKKVTAILLVLFVSITLLYIAYPENIIVRLLFVMQHAIFVLAIFYISQYLMEIGVLRSNEYVTKLSKYSFGIYVYHNWLGWNLYHSNYIITACRGGVLRAYRRTSNALNFYYFCTVN